VAALGAESPITIDDEDCVAKSFPQFHDTFSEMIHEPAFLAMQAYSVNG
jgi:5-enolpyruvylshikimate-3-phosphate synthase